jgi:branched-chain amino acid transport system permease protein
VMGTAYIFAIATMGLNLITGYTGQFNLAHARLHGRGRLHRGHPHGGPRLGLLGRLCAAGVVTAFLGYFMGILSLRLKGHYFSIFTLCVGYIMYLVIEKWEGLTHGTVGIMGIPAPEPIRRDPSSTSPLALYYLVWSSWLVVGMWAMRRIVNSLLGRTFMAIRNSDELAERWASTWHAQQALAFMLSVFYAGLAGGLYAGYVRFLGPDLAVSHHTFDMTMFMLIGGIGTLLGPLLGASLVPWLTQYLQFLQEYRFVVFGPS